MPSSPVWPVVSPERFANVTQTPIALSDLAGTWERIQLDYHIVPGYGTEQASPDMQVATSMTLGADGSVGGSVTGTWTYAAPVIVLKLSGGITETVQVSRERDWENRITSTLVFTGLNNNGTAIWGKKH